MTTMIQYVLTLVIAGVLGLNAQGEAKSHKEKTHKEKSVKHEKKSRKERKKAEKEAEKAREVVITPDLVKITEPVHQPDPVGVPATNIEVGSGKAQ